MTITLSHSQKIKRDRYLFFRHLTPKQCPVSMFVYFLISCNSANINHLLPPHSTRALGIKGRYIFIQVHCSHTPLPLTIFHP